ncbi:MATA-HMG [Gigaspora margarita]|uniref:MATA-HMG n=1 Tax=Gigaspora margarita TaxID=4874 RepID=A0A8H3X614_GIGMA|nr:MATA-HMG [Gigaspora margarita]
MSLFFRDGNPKIQYENSFNDELFSSSPYQLTLEIEQLISPPQDTRKAKKHRKNQSSPPRPQNRFLLFRRDFFEKQKRSGIKMKLDEMSRLAKTEWNNLPNEAIRCFEVLEQWAKDRHKEIYKDYKYAPKKNNGIKSKPKNTSRKNTKPERSPIIIHELTNELAIHHEKTIEVAIHHEKTTEVAQKESEKTSQISPIENLNVTEYNFSELSNFGFPSFDWSLFPDQSIYIPPLSPLYDSVDFHPLSPLHSECPAIDNAEPEIYPVVNFLPLSPLNSERSVIDNAELEIYPTVDSINFLPLHSECSAIDNAEPEIYPTVNFLPLSPLYSECSSIDNVEPELCQTFDFNEFLQLSPLYAEFPAIESAMYPTFDQVNLDEHIIYDLQPDVNFF